MRCRIYLKLLLFVIIFSACQADDCIDCQGLLTDAQLEFYPIDTSQISHFRVDSFVVFGNPGNHILHSYFLKQKQSNLIENSQQLNFQLIETLTSIQDSSVVYSNNFLGRRTSKELVLNRGFELVHMQFPVRSSANWNGRKYIFDDEIKVRIANEPLSYFFAWPQYFSSTFNLSESIKGIDYDSVMTVVHVDHNNLTERRLSIEKYAKRTGLVYRYVQIFDELCNQVDDICHSELEWTERADRGFYVEQWRIE